MVFTQHMPFIFIETKQILSDFILGMSLPICFIPTDKPYELVAVFLVSTDFFGPTESTQMETMVKAVLMLGVQDGAPRAFGFVRY